MEYRTHFASDRQLLEPRLPFDIAWDRFRMRLEKMSSFVIGVLHIQSHEIGLALKSNHFINLKWPSRILGPGWDIKLGLTRIPLYFILSSGMWLQENYIVGKSRNCHPLLGVWHWCWRLRKWGLQCNTCVDFANLLTLLFYWMSASKLHKGPAGTINCNAYVEECGYRAVSECHIWIVSWNFSRDHQLTEAGWFGMCGCSTKFHRTNSW